MTANLIVVLLLSVLVEDITCLALTDAEKALILDAHNSYRTAVSPPAADMQQMVSDANARKKEVVN